jgi:hypothetical protein
MVVARWKGQFDSHRMRKVLRGELIEGFDETESVPEPVVSSR